MPGIFGVALRGYGMLKKGKKVYDTIKSVKPNVPKTKTEKLKSKLAIAKQKTKASQAKLDQTVFDIKQRSKGKK
jgi:hypothetical protein